MQRKYNILDGETEKTLNTINNHLKNIKDKHSNFKEDVKEDISNFIAGTTSTLNLYDNSIKDITTKVEDFVATLNLYDNKIRALKDEAIRDAVKEAATQAIRETIQVLYDNGMFSLYSNADELRKDYLTFNERRRPTIE